MQQLCVNFPAGAGRPSASERDEYDHTQAGKNVLRSGRGGIQPNHIGSGGLSVSVQLMIFPSTVRRVY
uniref:Uncharacterized protein n=1 Tax=Anopheles dirus TaxID=7168 RepID=A0A182NJC9_9DIPT